MTLSAFDPHDERVRAFTARARAWERESRKTTCQVCDSVAYVLRVTVATAPGRTARIRLCWTCRVLSWRGRVLGA